MLKRGGMKHKGVNLLVVEPDRVGAGGSVRLGDTTVDRSVQVGLGEPILVAADSRSAVARDGRSARGSSRARSSCHGGSVSASFGEGSGSRHASSNSDELSDSRRCRGSSRCGSGSSNSGRDRSNNDSYTSKKSIS